MAKMSDDELAALLASHEHQSVGYYTSEIAEEQARALDYYYGEPFGDEQAGRSQVVDRTVAVVIDNALAALLKPFVSSDEAVMFTPRGPEDEEQAKQATEYVNYVFAIDNSGFSLMHDWFKSALLEKLGVLKVWWHDKTAPKTYEFKGVDAADFEQMGDVKFKEGPFVDDDGLYSGVFIKDYEDGCVKIEHVPSEEFRITPYSRTVESADYVAHITTRTRSELIEMGFEAKIVEGLSKWSGVEDDGRHDARYKDEDYGAESAGLQTDKARDRIAIAHEFPLVDYDGDGIAERREVIRCHDVILYNEEVDDHPFATVCPCPMPHKVYGLSMADQTMDLQRIMSVLWRQALDNTYLSNNPRPVLPESAERSDGTTWEDLTTTAPGAVIRTAGGAATLDTFTVPYAGDKALALIQFAETQQEARTGVTRIGQGLGADVLKKQEQTMGGLAIVEQAQNTRIEMIARIFAETGVKRLYRLILKALVQYQPRERMIRLRNEWVPVDPRGWNADMDLHVSVGLGVGSRTEQGQAAMSVLQVLNEASQSPYGYIVKPEGAYNALKKFLNAAGFKNTDDFLNEPSEENPPPEPAPDPEMLKVQAQVEADKAKMQLEAQKSQADMQLRQQEAAQTLELKAAEAEAKLQGEREKAQMEAQLALQKAQTEMQLAREKMEMELILARERMAMEREIASEQVSVKAETEKAKISSNRPGGSLSE